MREAATEISNCVTILQISAELDMKLTILIGYESYKALETTFRHLFRANAS